MTGPDRRTVLAGGLAAAGFGFGAPAQAAADRLALWDNTTGPHLRGAVLSQRRVMPRVDGPEFLGTGVTGSPISDAALAALADAGANLVVLSHPGPRHVAPPYAVDDAVMTSLDTLVGRCERAGLFAVIGYRAGPGRSAFTFHRDSAGDWFPADLLDEHLWQSREAGDAWCEMWRETARRFRARPNIVGYLPMVEPNANLVARGPDGGDLDEWDPQRLADRVAGTPADWPVLFARIARAIRAEDADTPILASPDGYASARFAPLLDRDAVPGIVLALHDYGPRAYTHQDRNAGITFQPDEAAFRPDVAGPWMMGEFGTARWAPRADRYLAGRIASLEAAGAGWSVFRWDTGYRIYENRENRFNPVYGTRPRAAHPVASSPLVEVLRSAWQRNRERPRLALRR